MHIDHRQRQSQQGQILSSQQTGDIAVVVDTLDDIDKARSVSISQVAINWVLNKSGMASVVVGARTIAQLEDNLKAES